MESACADEGFAVLNVKALDEIFKEKLGIDYPRYTMILACAPPLAKMALDVSRDAGTLFPCSFVVYEEEDGRVYVAHTSIMRASAELGLAPPDKMQPVIEETGKRVRKLWERL